MGSLGAWSVSGSVWPVTCPAWTHGAHSCPPSAGRSQREAQPRVWSPEPGAVHEPPAAAAARGSDTVRRRLPRPGTACRLVTPTRPPHCTRGFGARGCQRPQDQRSCVTSSRWSCVGPESVALAFPVCSAEAGCDSVTEALGAEMEGLRLRPLVTERGLLSPRKDGSPAPSARGLPADRSADAPPALEADLRQGHSFINLLYDLSLQGQVVAAPVKDGPSCHARTGLPCPLSRAKDTVSEGRPPATLGAPLPLAHCEARGRHAQQALGASVLGLPR